MISEPIWEDEAHELWLAEKYVKKAQERVDKIKRVLEKAEKSLKQEIRMYRSAYQNCDVAVGEFDPDVDVEDLSSKEIYDRYYK